MTQDRLSNLTIISIEGDILNQLDVHGFVKDFAIKKSRKIDFLIISYHMHKKSFYFIFIFVYLVCIHAAS